MHDFRHLLKAHEFAETMLRDQRLILESVGGLHSQLLANMQSVQQSLVPVADYFRNQSILKSELLGMLDTTWKAHEEQWRSLLNTAIGAHEEQWQSVIKNLALTTNLGASIPDFLYPFLKTLTSQAVNVFPEAEETTNELMTVETTESLPEQAAGAPVTWYNLIMALIAIYQIIAMHYSSHQNTVQHEELIVELQKQTVLSEQQLEIDKERLLLEEKRLAQQQRLEEQFGAFLELVQPFIYEDQDEVQDHQ